MPKVSLKIKVAPFYGPWCSLVAISDRLYSWITEIGLLCVMQSNHFRHNPRCWLGAENVFYAISLERVKTEDRIAAFDYTLITSASDVNSRATQGLEAPPRTSASHLASDPGSRPSAAQSWPELSMATRPGQRTLEAARGNGYAPVNGTPVTMMMMMMMSLDIPNTYREHIHGYGSAESTYSVKNDFLKMQIGAFSTRNTRPHVQLSAANLLCGNTLSLCHCASEKAYRITDWGWRMSGTIRNVPVRERRTRVRIRDQVRDRTA